MEKIESFSGKYRFLSNFYVFEVPIFDDLRVPHYAVENAFQASKSLYKPDRLDIQKVTPAVAKRMGQRVELREDWDEIKRAIMLQLVAQKFINNPDLRKDLLKTGDALLIEGNYWNDRYWGAVNGSGSNHLGKILMHVRRLFTE